MTTQDVADALARRRLGYGRGARMKFEQDEVRLTGGVRHGETQGGPVAIEVGNTEWPKWEKVMTADPVDPAMLDGLARNAPLTRPRPGHADLVGMQKYDFDEARPDPGARHRPRDRRPRRARPGGLGVPRQATGAQLVSHVVELGGVACSGRLGARRPTTSTRLDDDPVRCLDPDAAKLMVERSTRPTRTATPSAAWSRWSCTACRPGLGSHVHWDRRLDARLAGALMGIQAIKGVEVGDGFELAATPGSLAHDEIVTEDGAIRRTSGRSGGTEGGMTTGEVLRVRAAMKPIATVPRALRTVDVATGEPAVAHHQRSDVCAVPAAGIVAEAMVALVLADAVLEKFGGDSVAETRRNVESLPGHPEVPVSAARWSSSSARWARARRPSAGVSPSGWGVSFRDTDADVEAAEGRAVADIFVDYGEAALPRPRARRGRPRRWASHDGVLALGGGAVLDPATRGAARRAPGGLPAGRPGRRGRAGSGWASRDRCCSATSAAGSSSSSTSAPRSTSPSRRTWSTPTASAPTRWSQAGPGGGRGGGRP